ncbi:MAG: hypothetical protein R3326_06150 [Gemmatimonadota bacterium]|nr:hypothetical protein [Gemmatimonadota bacterium]
MNNLLKWLVILGLAIFLWTEGWPWLQGELDRLGGRSPTVAAAGSDEASRCVALATDASRSLSSGIGRFVSPPVDTSAWMRFAGQVQEHRRRADRACGCVDEACAPARDAMAELESLLQDLDGVARGSAEAYFNPATRQQRIDQLLDRARAEL